MKVLPYLWIILISLFMISCSDDSKSSSSGATYIQLSTVASTDGEVKAGYTLAVSVTVETDGTLKDVPVVVSGIPGNDENNSVYFDVTEIIEVTAGSNEYSIDITVPRDVDLGDYKLIAMIDPDDLYGSWDDETQFGESSSVLTVLDHGPDDVIVAGGVDEDDESLLDDVNAAPALSTTSSISAISIEATDENVSVDVTLTLYPNLVDLNQTDINITACVNVGTECIALPLWSSEGNGTLSNTLSLYDLEYGYETTVAVDTVVPYTTVAQIVQEIVDNISLTNPVALLDTTLDVTLFYNGQQKVYPIGLRFVPTAELLDALLAPAPQLAPARASGTCTQQLLNYSKSFKRNKYGKRFGAGAYARGSSGLDGDGLHAKVYGSVTGKAMGRKDNFMRLHFNADALPGSFEGTGYDLDLEALGVTIYSKSKSLSDVSYLSTPTVTSEEEAAIDLKIASGDTNLSKAALIKQKVYKKAKKNVTEYTGTGSTAIGYVYDWEIGKKKGYSQQYFVGIVPVTITAGASATVGFVADIHLDGITSLTGTFRPKAGMEPMCQVVSVSQASTVPESKLISGCSMRVLRTA